MGEYIIPFEEWLIQHGYENNAYNRGAPLLYSMYDKDKSNQVNSVWHDLQGGKISALDAQGALSTAGVSLSPDMQEYLNNSLATQAADKQFEQTKLLRDTDLTSAASQLESLGLNQGSVVQTGGSHAGPVQQADTSHRNIAQEKAITDANNKASMTRTILSLIGGLAGAGITGGALGASRIAAAKLASATAHSATKAFSVSPSLIRKVYNAGPSHGDYSRFSRLGYFDSI